MIDRFKNHFTALRLQIVSILCGILMPYQRYCLHQMLRVFLGYSMGSILWSMYATGVKNYVFIGTIFFMGVYYINYCQLTYWPSESCIT